MALQRIAVLLDVAISSFHRSTFIGVQRALAETGLEAIYLGVGCLNIYHEEYRYSKDLLDLVSAQEFDAILSVSSSLVNQGGTPILEEFLRTHREIPMVSMGTSVIGEPVFVYDNAAGMRKMAEHLVLDHGYRDIVYVSGPSSNREAIVRQDAFRAVMREEGLELDRDHLYEGDFLARSGEAAVADIIDHKGLKPQVFACANDLMALGVYSALLRRGISVPWDIAVTGCDDLQFSRSQFHQFTTIRQSFEPLAVQAIHYLKARLDGAPETEPAEMEPVLCIRRSCGCRHQNNFGKTRLTEQPPAIVKEIALDRESKVIQADNDRAQKIGNSQDNTAVELKVAAEAGDVQALRRVFSKRVHYQVTGNRPLYKLLSLIDSIKSPEYSADLYNLLFEELTQIEFADYWDKRGLQFAMDRVTNLIERAIATSLDFNKEQDLVGELLYTMHGQVIHLIRFEDPFDIQAGAKHVIRMSNRDSWDNPGPGSWFPPRGSGSFVVNIILNRDSHYGYLVCDADIPSIDLHEVLYKRFCGIIQNYTSMLMTHELNEQLLVEMKERKEVEKRLREALEQVERMSTEDDLTGLKNRRGFMALAEQQIRYMKREKQDFIILYIDLDGLKIINDKYGHNEGDVAIKAAAEIIVSALRDSDIIARIGGDEYTALVSNAEERCFPGIKNRIMELCKEKNRILARDWDLSMSIGHCDSGKGSGRSLEEMLACADEELYREKQEKKRKRGQ